jgi:hypothetical protein
MGEELQRKYTIDQLKPISKQVPDNTKNSFEVQRIVDHKLTEDGYEFLVKWKNYSDADNSWIKAEDFNSLKPIKTYWKSIKKPKGNKANKANKAKKANKANKANKAKKAKEAKEANKANKAKSAKQAEHKVRSITLKLIDHTVWGEPCEVMPHRNTPKSKHSQSRSHKPGADEGLGSHRDNSQRNSYP